MDNRNRNLLILLLAGAGILACSNDENSLSRSDTILQRVIDDNNIRPLPTRQSEADPKYLLGRALFYDPILSGNRDVSCATCHLYQYGSSDGLPKSVGVHGEGLGAARISLNDREGHPRNSQDLWNRDNNSALALFWDGRVEYIDPLERRFRTPMGEALPDGLENTLAAQALFPLITPDEMLGYPGDTSGSGLPGEHAGRKNELAAIPGGPDDPQRMALIHSAIVQRLLNHDSDTPAAWQQEYQNLFLAAYPDTGLAQFGISHVANALAHYEEIAFATRATPWDAYVAGDLTALTASQKSGALVFFGRGKCFVCHSGPLFSDFQYYALGIPNVTPKYGDKVPDFGRFYTTREPDDLFKFRTPPLRNVMRTAPYFHDGSQSSLEEAIRHHTDPLRFAGQYDAGGTLQMSLAEVEAVREILEIQIRLTNEEIERLIVFLSSLNDELPDDMSLFVPAEVPSSLPVIDTLGR